MYPTLKLLDYLYDQGTQRNSKENFYKEASSLITKMKSNDFNNNEIMDAVKCI